MDAQECARATRVVIVHRGGRFMVAPQMATQERALGIPPRSLYFRGRSAVLGDLPVPVVADLFGLFPGWLVELALTATTQKVPAERAVEAFTAACRDWGRHHLAEVPAADRLADLLFTVVDEADASALVLFSAWRGVPRPDDPPARLAHALMVARELRGGLHFAALRASGLGVVDALLSDPDVGPERLRQTGWRQQDVDRAVAGLTAPDDARRRWHRAQDITDETFGMCLGVLDDRERAELSAGLQTAA